ncbi:MAG: hypothetical protein HWE12_11685 [Oceanospirillaceae bacterium]|nr:hypothetical protein [Oceanospirillaceae bacterium]
MCNIRELAEVSARLDVAVYTNIDDIHSPADLYDKYEMTAISILDSNEYRFSDGSLEIFLKRYLELKAEQLLGQQP